MKWGTHYGFHKANAVLIDMSGVAGGGLIREKAGDKPRSDIWSFHFRIL